MSLHSQSERALRDRIEEGGFVVALSGGGHRASLATLGALMAIVDRGLGAKVIQVASVSGGTNTNAFVAQRCRLEDLGPTELDKIAEELATTIIRKGALTNGWIALLILAPLILAVAAAILLYQLIGSPLWLAVEFAVAFAVVIALAALFARGLAVEWLLDRRYFRQSSATENRKYWGRARLTSLSGGRIDHVFCMTDLALGLPVYASSQHGGMIWRRLEAEPNVRDAMRFQTFDAGHLSIAEVVRASAAFPGIPPRRLRIPPDPQIDLVAKLPQVAFLADGGLWNNLGTQVCREDRFIGSHAAWENGVLRPYGPVPADMPVLCFNGSAPLKPACPCAFQVPGIALLRSLLQVAAIFTANTVLPRVNAMRRAFRRRVTFEVTRSDYKDPLDLVADLRPVEDTVDAYDHGALLPEQIRESDPQVKEWEKRTLLRVRSAFEHAATDTKTNWLAYILNTPEPQGSYPTRGLANIEDWDALRCSTSWKQLVEKGGTDRVDAPTTLGRIEPGLARRLIIRGYLNTYITSLFLAPLADGELDRLAKLPGRINKIVGG